LLLARPLPAESSSLKSELATEPGSHLQTRDSQLCDTFQAVVATVKNTSLELSLPAIINHP
jgi:hypothetical protein